MRFEDNDRPPRRNFAGGGFRRIFFGMAGLLTAIAIGAGPVPSAQATDIATTTTVECPIVTPGTHERLCTATTSANSLSALGDIAEGNPDFVRGINFTIARGGGSFNDGGAVASCIPVKVTAASISCAAIFHSSVLGLNTVAAAFEADEFTGIKFLNSGDVDAFQEVQIPSAISTQCSPSAVPINEPTTCTATVSHQTAIQTPPGGTVTFSAVTSRVDTPLGAVCTLQRVSDKTSSCSLPVVPLGLNLTLKMVYQPADASFVASEATTEAIKSQPRGSATRLSCAPLAAALTCTATVSDSTPGHPIVPGGTVAFATNGSGRFSSPQCALQPAAASSSCSVIYTPSGPGVEAITASYNGDAVHAVSNGSATAALPTTAPPTARPKVSVTKKPKAKTSARRATFAFKSSTPGATFQCKLDRKPFKPCASPLRIKVKPGRHTLRVRAVNSQGVAGSPTVVKWTVLK